MFDCTTVELVRKAFDEGRGDKLYVMVPADDGGQTYEMKCMASRFNHGEGCPVEIEQRNRSR